MSFDPTSLLVAFVVGSVGFVCFVFGKRQGRLPHMLAGVALIVYPYFVTNPLLSIGVGAGILALLWLGVRLGA
ncbi:MAG: hypothetical protein ABSC94_26530 [Polyangiaceae bacterium]|jgi:hypothetical protein